MGVCKRKGCEIPPLKSQRLQRLLVLEYDPTRSRIDHVTFVFVSQVRKKRAIDARVSVNLKHVIVATCQQGQDHPKDPLKKKIRVNKTEMSIIIGMAGRRGGGGDRVKAQFPASSLEILKHRGT